MSAAAPAGPYEAEMRLFHDAIASEQKLLIGYRDRQGFRTFRAVKPIEILEDSAPPLLVAWCEMREAVRNFRIDRIESCMRMEEYFRGETELLRLMWTATRGTP